MRTDCFVETVFVSTSSVTAVTPVSLRLGHAAALTAPRAVIHYRVAASLPGLGEGKGYTASDQTPEMNNLRRSNGGSKPPPYEIKPTLRLTKLN